MMAPTLAEFLAVVPGRRRRSAGPDGATGFRISCPCHKGEGLSLHAWDAGGRVGLKCFARDCDYRDILAAAGFKANARSSSGSGTARQTRQRNGAHSGAWEPSSPAPERLRHPKLGAPSRSWEIRDSGSRLFAIHARFDPPEGRKQFAWWRNGAWKLGAERVRQAPLYGSEVARTLDAARQVFLVEGEKAADALRQIGAQALGTVTGASAVPGREALEVLRGRRVVLWPDADETGRNHMGRIAAALRGVASELRVFSPGDLADGGDAVEWLGAREWLDSADVVAELEAAAESVAIASRKPQTAGAVCLADVAPEVVEFLWKPRIPLGKLTILEGDPGQGKSYITLALAAAVSRGCGLPGAERFEPAPVLLLTAEDGIADTVRPRLDALQADPARIFVRGELLDLASSEGLNKLERLVEEHRPRLLILDPISAYVGARTDTHRANEVRGVLAPLAGLAERWRLAVLIVRHLSKAQSLRPIHRGLGSIDFTAAARSVLLAGSAPENPEARALVHTKCNVAKPAPALGYRITEVESQARFEWTGESSLTAAEILAAALPSREPGRIEDARAFLREVLAEGPIPVDDLRRMAQQAGHSWRTVEEAKRREEVRSRRRGFGRGSRCVWELPLATPPDTP